MYLNTLSITAEHVLGVLLNNLEVSYSIRELSREVKQDYKIVFTTVKTLAKEKLVMITRVSNINQCRLHLSQEYSSLFGFISERFARQKVSTPIWNALQDIISSLSNPFYTLLLFGSHAKNTARKTSDIDLLFIISELRQEKEIVASVHKSALLNNIKINPVILTQKEFIKGLQEKSISQEAYKKHVLIKGGELFYTILSHA